MLHKLRNVVIGFASCFLAVFPAVQDIHAQEHTRHLLVQDAIDSALLNNRDIRVAGLDEKIAASKWRETNAIFLPQLDLSYSALNTNNPLNAFGFKLQQQSVKAEDFAPSLLNNPNGVSDFSTRLQVKQPVLNMDLLYLRKAALVQKELYELKTQRSREYVVFEVQKAYMQLQLAYDAAEVLQETLKTAEALYEFTSNRVKEGLLQQSDALNTKVWVTSVETNLAEARNNIRNASDYMSLVTGCATGTIYTVEKTLKQTGNLSADTTVPAGRADLAAIQKAIEASGLMIQSTRMSYLPRVNAFAAWQLNDSRALGFASDSYLAGIQLSWDIFKGNAIKNKIASQKLERNKLTEQLAGLQEQSQLELDKNRRTLVTARYAINQQTKAVESATEALRILQDRYAQGLVNSIDILTAQTQLSQQKLGLVTAIFNYNTTAAYIQYLAASSKQ